MKTQTGIWIDGTKALVIAFNKGKETVREILSNIENHVHHPQHEGDRGTLMGTHHLSNEKKFQQRHLHQENKFMDQVITEIKNADEIFIMGLSGMKHKLHNRIEENKQIKDKLKGLASADHLTLNQCVAKVKEFYNI